MNSLKGYLWRYKGIVGLNVIFIILAAGFNVGLAFILQNVIDSTMNSSVEELGHAILLGVAFLGINFVIGIVRKCLGALYIKKIVTKLKEDVFSCMLQKNMKSFKEENSATYISILTNDIKMIEDSYFNNILQMIFYGTSFVLALVSLIWISPMITFTIAIVAMLPMMIPMIFGKRLSKKREVYSEQLEDFTTKVKDYFNGFEVIKSFNVEKRTKEAYNDTNKKTEKSKFVMNINIACIDEMSGFFGFMMFIITMGLGSYFVIKGSLTMGLMIAMVQLLNSIVGPISMLSSQTNQLKSIKTIEDKLIAIMTSQIAEDTGELKGTYTDSIVFEDVKFQYEEERPILKGVNLELKKGKKYAIVGGSGSGKSTLLKLLLRYHENFEGSIKIDGVDNRSIHTDSLYQILSMIHQDVFMFDDTIENNIKLYQNYTEEAVQKAIKRAGLMQLVDKLGQGTQSEVGENGNRLSGGEKQRVAIARTLVKGTPILMLDEATSSLDNETAYNIEKSILEVEDLTCLVVTHKLNKEMLEKYDEIIVLKDGQVEEIGQFNRLIEDKGYFYSLYNVMGKAELVA